MRTKSMQVFGRAAVLIAAGAVALSACTDKQLVVDRPGVEARMKVVLMQQYPTQFQALKSVSCEGDLKGKVGASERCTLHADDGSTIGATATVTKVQGSDVQFDIKVDNKVATGPTTSTPG